MPVVVKGEKREWILMLAGDTAAGVQLPPCYLLRTPMMA